MVKLPIKFSSSALTDENFEKPWIIKSGEVTTSCSIPVEFNGCGGGFSPEDLFLQSLINCFIGTFKVYAKNSAVKFGSLAVNGNLVVDKGGAGNITMKSCHIEIKAEGCDRPERLQNLVSKVFKDGFILNSVKTAISYDLKFDRLSYEKEI